MKLILNEKNEVVAYIGERSLHREVETDSIPPYFKEEFKPYYFLYDGEYIKYNPYYHQDSDEPIKADITLLKMQNAFLTLQLADTQENRKLDSKVISDLEQRVGQLEINQPEDGGTE